MKTIVSRIGAIVALGAIALVLTGAVNDDDRTASGREVEELRALVKSLEDKVATLENRIQQMENRNVPMTFRTFPQFKFSPPKVPGHPGFVVPLPKADPPKHWGKGEFNGHQYYIVPLQER